MMPESRDAIADDLFVASAPVVMHTRFLAISLLTYHVPWPTVSTKVISAGSQCARKSDEKFGAAL